MRGVSWLAAKPVSFSRRTLLHGLSKYHLLIPYKVGDRLLNECGTLVGNTDRRKLKYSEKKPVSGPQFLPTIWQELARDWSRAPAVKGWRLTKWTMGTAGVTLVWSQYPKLDWMRMKSTDVSHRAYVYFIITMALLWLRRRPSFNPGPIRVRFVVEKVALAQGFLSYAIPTFQDISPLKFSMPLRSTKQKSNQGTSTCATSLCPFSYTCVLYVSLGF